MHKEMNEARSSRQRARVERKYKAKHLFTGTLVLIGALIFLGFRAYDITTNDEPLPNTFEFESSEQIDSILDQLKEEQRNQEVLESE